MTELIPRVLYRARGCYCLGPLGCYDVGSTVEVEGRSRVVDRIDPDGAGIACEDGCPPLRFPCKSLAQQTPRQRDQITNQILANRRRHGLSAVDPRSYA